MKDEEGGTYFVDDRMTREWGFWRLIWHWLRGHELTHWDREYPPPVCRTCELARLYNQSKLK